MINVRLPRRYGVRWLRLKSLNINNMFLMNRQDDVTGLKLSVQRRMFNAYTLIKTNINMSCLGWSEAFVPEKTLHAKCYEQYCICMKSLFIKRIFVSSYIFILLWSLWHTWLLAETLVVVLVHTVYNTVLFCFQRRPYPNQLIQTSHPLSSLEGCVCLRY